MTREVGPYVDRKTHLGRLLTAARVEKGLSQARCAELLGVSRITYVHIEGGSHFPGAGRLADYCAVLGVGAMELLCALRADARER